MVAAGPLRREGYTVEIDKDGEQALAAIKCEAFDLVLDVRMPRMEGL